MRNILWSSCPVSEWSIEMIKIAFSFEAIKYRHITPDKGTNEWLLRSQQCLSSFMEFIQTRLLHLKVLFGLLAIFGIFFNYEVKFPELKHVNFFKSTPRNTFLEKTQGHDKGSKSDGHIRDLIDIRKLVSGFPGQTLCSTQQHTDICRRCEIKWHKSVHGVFGERKYP